MDYSNVRKVLTKVYSLVQIRDQYYLTDKARQNAAYCISADGASAAGDRGTWIKICAFDTLEKNMAGLAAYMFGGEKCSNFEAAEKTLETARSEAQEQEIIKTVFQVEDWKRIRRKSPHGALAVDILVSGNDGNKRISCVLDNMCVEIGWHWQEDPTRYKKFLRVVAKADSGLSFIEKNIPDPAPEFVLQLLSLILTKTQKQVRNTLTG